MVRARIVCPIAMQKSHLRGGLCVVQGSVIAAKREGIGLRCGEP